MPSLNFKINYLFLNNLLIIYQSIITRKNVVLKLEKRWKGTKPRVLIFLLINVLTCASIHIFTIYNRNFSFWPNFDSLHYFYRALFLWWQEKGKSLNEKTFHLNVNKFFLMQLLQLKQLLFFWSQVCSQSENLLMHSGYYLTLFKCRWVSSVYWLSVLKRKFWLNMIVLGRRSSNARHGLCPFGGWSTGEEDPCWRSPPLSRAAACKWL